jgi:hypothetical protein
MIERRAVPREIVLLHTAAAEQQIRGLGAKGSRHILARADLLLLEVLAQLSTQYRDRYLESASHAV